MLILSPFGWDYVGGLSFEQALLDPREHVERRGSRLSTLAGVTFIEEAEGRERADGSRSVP